MPDQLQLRGGTTTEHNSFTGASKEVTIDTTKKTAVVHDGSVAGGNPLMREDGANSALIDGSATEPALAFAGDSANTGIYSPGTDQLAVSTNGVERVEWGTSEVVFNDGGANYDFRIEGDTNANLLFVDASADAIGIGTSNPGVKCSIGGVSGTALQLKTADTNFSALNIGIAADHSFINSTASGSGTVHPLAFDINGTERARIDTSGRLLVGTTSNIGPSTDNRDTLNVVSASGGALLFGRNDTEVTAGNTIGRLRFYGNDSNGTYEECASINVAADDTHATGDKPTRIEFRTTADGASSPTERMRITSAGDVGIGVTPTRGPLHLHKDGTTNTYIKLTNGVTGSTTGDGAEIVVNTSGELLFNNRETQPIRFLTQANERARIDSSGRLLVGTSSARGVGGSITGDLYVEGNSVTQAVVINNENSATGPSLRFGKSRGTTSGSNTVVQAADTLGSIIFAGADGTDLVSSGALIKAEVDGTPGSNDMPGRLVFSTTADGASSPTERMRITNSGFTKSTSTGSYQSSTADYHESRSDEPDWIHYFTNTHASIPNGIIVRYTNAAPNDTGKHFIYCLDTAGVKFDVRSNGGIANYQSNDANLCDEREKKNIEALDSTWNCLKNWDLKKFHYNEDADTDDKRYGVIAQQVAEHCPEVITDWVKQKAEDAVLDEDGNVVTPAQEEIVRMGVKEQQMMWMAIKALQEAQTRIEALEAEVAALKGA